MRGTITASVCMLAIVAAVGSAAAEPSPEPAGKQEPSSTEKKVPIPIVGGCLHVPPWCFSWALGADVALGQEDPAGFSAPVGGGCAVFDAEGNCLVPLPRASLGAGTDIVYIPLVGCAAEGAGGDCFASFFLLSAASLETDPILTIGGCIFRDPATGECLVPGLALPALDATW